MYSKKLVIGLSLLFLISFMTTAALARGSARYLEVDLCLDSCDTGSGGGKGGPKKSLTDLVLVELAPPAGTVTFDSFKALASGGKLAGLGPDDVTVEVVATGKAANVVCSNSGGNTVPGQPQEFKASGLVEIPSELFTKNGSTEFGVKTNTPVLTPEQVGCPQDHNWSATAQTVLWNGPVTVTAFQAGNPPVVAAFNCSMSNPNDLTCTRVD